MCQPRALGGPNAPQTRTSGRKLETRVRQPSQQNQPDEPEFTPARRVETLMPCSHPLPAWRTDRVNPKTGKPVIVLREPQLHQEALKLPCGTCIGCRTGRAREWAVRCSLEEKSHATTCWATLTYEEKYKPPTLKKDHLQGFLKRLRSRVKHPLRFFASGEYGDKFGRPHFHAILFGVALGEGSQVEQAWPYGQAQVDVLTPAAISYVAGYTSKKVGRASHYLEDVFERVDPDTGEVYNYQPPFIQMSRRPGIADKARKHWRSWRDTAITDGLTVPVPRFLHEAWLNNATEEEKRHLNEEKLKRRTHLETKGHYGIAKMEARELNAYAKQRMRAYERGNH